MSREKDYEVGHGKPPKHAQFQKGKSGNPKGRPKGSRNFATDLDEVLSAPVTITENGVQKKVSSQRAALLRLLAKALNGDVRALERILAMAADRSAEKQAQSVERSLAADESDILERYFADVRQGAGLDVNPAPGEEQPDGE